MYFLNLSRVIFKNLTISLNFNSLVAQSGAKVDNLGCGESWGFGIECTVWTLEDIS
jgi:hypothetical protein